MRFASGGRTLERLAGGGRPRGPRTPQRWRTVRVGPDPWGAGDVDDLAWLRGDRPARLREALQLGLLFPATRVMARPRVIGAADLMHAPQPAVLAPNHESDIDTPLVLLALPRTWRTRTVVGAASDRFYRRRRTALMSGLWINTFPFDRGGGQRRGLASAAAHLREGRNVLLVPQGTRGAGPEGYHPGVAELALSAGVPIIPVHLGDVIFVGGDPEACRRLGFRRADTMRDALEMAEQVVGRDPSLTHFHCPPVFYAQVTA